MSLYYWKRSRAWIDWYWKSIRERGTDDQRNLSGVNRIRESLAGKAKQSQSKEKQEKKKSCVRINGENCSCIREREKGVDQSVSLGLFWLYMLPLLLFLIHCIPLLFSLKINDTTAPLLSLYTVIRKYSRAGRWHAHLQIAWFQYALSLRRFMHSNFNGTIWWQFGCSPLRSNQLFPSITRRGGALSFSSKRLWSSVWWWKSRHFLQTFFHRTATALICPNANWSKEVEGPLKPAKDITFCRLQLPIWHPSPQNTVCVCMCVDQLRLYRFGSPGLGLHGESTEAPWLHRNAPTLNMFWSNQRWL